jgi:hypothetical protein
MRPRAFRYLWGNSAPVQEECDRDVGRLAIDARQASYRGLNPCAAHA